ncbi:MAG: hypothetical protein ACT4QG_12305 [Sporichthyaceae bacterium]
MEDEAHYRGAELPRPVALVTTRADFEAYLDATGAGWRGVWPEVQPRQAAFQGLLTTLDEEMSVLAGPPELIQIDGKGLHPVRAAIATPPPPDGDFEWRPGDRSDAQRS